MKPSEVFHKTVIACINGDRKHGWKQDDSMAVIAAIWESETGDKIDPDIAKLIEKVVNPSAFRLYLESKAVNMLDKQDKKKAHDDLFADFVKNEAKTEAK